MIASVDKVSRMYPSHLQVIKDMSLPAPIDLILCVHNVEYVNKVRARIPETDTAVGVHASMYSGTCCSWILLADAATAR